VSVENVVAAYVNRTVVTCCRKHSHGLRWENLLCAMACLQAIEVEEADVIVIDEGPSESDDSAIQPDSGRTRRACLGRMRTRTLSESGAPSSAGAERGPLERGHSFPVAATVKSQYTTSLVDSGFDKRHFVTGEL